MKKYSRYLTLISLIVLLAQGAIRPAFAQSATTYTGDFATAFTNPERGFHNRYEIINDVNVNDYASSATSIAGFSPDMLDRTFSRAKADGDTLIHSYIHLDKFTNTDTLPQELLDNLQSGLDAIRAAGLKIVLRPAYTWSTPPSVPESRILGHIGQLNAVISANADVVMHLEAGYLGAWGEWHDDQYTDFFNRTEADTRYRVMQKILSTTPSNIPVVMRYPIDIREVTTPSVMPAPAGTPAITQDQMDRIGFHDDCFLSDSADMGTYDNNSWMGWFDVPTKKQWMYDLATSFGANKMVGGETCDSAGDDDPAGVNVQSEMSKLNYTEINEDYAPVNTNIWKAANLAASGNDPAETAFVRLKRKMGYRLRLTDATFPTSATAGGTFSFSANLQNDGYAGIIKPRPLFLTFQSSTARFDIPLSDIDVRLWLSGANSIALHTITLPSNMPNGTYKLALWLPDQAATLRSRPEYSVRFADLNMWDTTAGYNVLSTAITIGGGCTTNCPTSIPTNTATRVVTATPTTVSVTAPPTTASGTATMTRTPTATSVSGNPYEAEAPGNTLTGSAIIAPCTACSNGQEVGYVGNNTGTLQFNGVSEASAGNYTITIAYINGDTVARNASLSVNGGTATNVTFPVGVAGNWNTISTVNVTVSLNTGSNTLKFANSTAGSWGPDFDRIFVGGVTGPTNTPVAATATPTKTNTPGAATATKTNTPAATFQPPTNTPSGATATKTSTPAPSATSGGTLSIDAFSNSTTWNNHVNDLNQSLSWSMDSLYYGSNPPGEIVMNSGGTNQYYQENINQSLSAYATLDLRLRDWNSGSGTEQHWNIVLNDGTDHIVALSSYGIASGTYQDFNIPLSAFGATLANAKYVRIVHKDTTYAVLLCDSVSVH